MRTYVRTHARTYVCALTHALQYDGPSHFCEPPPGGASTAHLLPSGQQPFRVHQLFSHTIPQHTKPLTQLLPSWCHSQLSHDARGQGTRSHQMNHPPRCIHIYHPSLGPQPMTRQLNHKETQLRSCDLWDFLLLTPPEAVLPTGP